MGCGAPSKIRIAHNARIKTVDTGVMQETHGFISGEDWEPQGQGAAALHLERDNILYVAGNKGLALFDLTDPATIERIRDVIDTGSQSLHGGATMVKNDGILYVAGGRGLRVLDVTSAAAPSLEGELIDTGACADNAGVAGALTGKILYIAGGKGLAVMDIGADPKKPERVGDIIQTGVFADMTPVAMLLLESKNIMYLAGSLGLAVMDVTDRVKPERFGQVIKTKAIRPLRGSCVAMLAKGNFLYLGGCDGLAVFDISDPKAPRELSRTHTGCFPFDGSAAMLLSEPANSTLICYGNRGMRFFSLSQGEKPVPQGRVMEGGVACSDSGVGILRHGNTLVLAGGKGLGLFKYDVLYGQAEEQK